VGYVKKGTVLPLNVNPGFMPRYFSECISESNHELSWLLPLHTESSSLLNLARTQNGRYFLDSGAEYALLLDSDMVWEPKDIVRLRKTAREKNAKIVSGLYFGQQLGRIFPVAYGLTDRGLLPFAMLPSLDQPFKVDGVGGGALLVHRDVYEAVADMQRGQTAYLWQEEMYAPATDSQVSEDLVFCLRAKEAGFDIWLEPRAIFNHLKKPDILGLEDYAAFVETLNLPNRSTDSDDVLIPSGE